MQLSDAFIKLREEWFNYHLYSPAHERMDEDESYEESRKESIEQVLKENNDKIEDNYKNYPENTKLEVITSIEVVDSEDYPEKGLRLLPGAVITVISHGHIYSRISFNISDICARDVIIRTADLKEKCKKL